MNQQNSPGALRKLWRRAFWNQYNLILLSGSALFSLTTQSVVPALVGAGAEVLWLVLGADSGLFRRWAATKEAQEQREALRQQALAALAQLSEPDQARYLALQVLSGEIQAMARDNPSLSGDLLSPEVQKIERLELSFLQMAVLRARLYAYLLENREEDIRADIEYCEGQLTGEENPEVALSLQQSLALARKRMEQHKHISASFRALEVKMDTLEKTFRYLKSHILQIGKREELTDEIDDLIAGVDSVEQLSVATDRMLAELHGVRTAPAKTSGSTASAASAPGQKPPAARKGARQQAKA